MSFHITTRWPFSTNVHYPLFQELRCLFVKSALYHYFAFTLFSLKWTINLGLSWVEVLFFINSPKKKTLEVISKNWQSKLELGNADKTNSSIFRKIWNSFNHKCREKASKHNMKISKRDSTTVKIKPSRIVCLKSRFWNFWQKLRILLWRYDCKKAEESREEQFLSFMLFFLENHTDHESFRAPGGCLSDQIKVTLNWLSLMNLL